MGACCFWCLRHCCPPPPTLLDSPVQKFEISLPMDSAKERSRALTVVAEFRGVNSMEIEGPEKSKIVVVGKGVDPVLLTRCLRKKLGCPARIDKLEEKKEEKKVEKKEEEKPTVLPCRCYPEAYVVTPVTEQAGRTIL